jgi:MFS family permease
MGGLLAMQLQPKHPMYMATWCVFFFGGLPLALSVPLRVEWSVLAAFAGGAAVQVFGVLWLTTLQQKVPAEMLSRVSAYDHLGSIALAPLGIVTAGILYESLGYRTTLILAALAIIIPTALVLTVRDVREVTIHYFTGVEDDDAAAQPSSENS